MPSKRRAYDSVDPEFDDQIPDQFSTTKPTKKDFFSTFAEAFERNGLNHDCEFSLISHSNAYKVKDICNFVAGSFA